MHKAKTDQTGKKFTVLLMAYYGMFAIGPSFYVVVLGQKGVPSQYIGVFTALIALTASIAQPLYGFLCDKTCKARQILLAAVTAAVCAYTMLIAVKSLAALAVCSLIIGFTLNAMYGFAESWLSKLGCEKLGVNFGAVRSFGSLAFAVTAVVYGFAFDYFGAWSMPLCMAVFLVAMILVATRCQNPIPQAANTPPVRFSRALQVLLHNRRYVLVVVCYTLAAMPTAALNAYYPTHLEVLGGTASSMGFAWFVMACSEFFIMQFYKKLEQRFGVLRLLGFAFLMFAVKNAAIALAPNVATAVLAAVLQAFCYGMVLPAAQSFVAGSVSQEYASTAQLVCNTGGLMVSQLPGALLGGWLVGVMPVSRMLLVMAGFAVLAFVLYVVGLRYTAPASEKPLPE